MSVEKEMEELLFKESPLKALPRGREADRPATYPMEISNRMNREGERKEIKDFQNDPGLIMVAPRRVYTRINQPSS